MVEVTGYTLAGVGDTTPPGPGTALAVTASTPTIAALSSTNPEDADYTVVMIRRAAGNTPPASPTAGTLVSDVAKPDGTVTGTGLTASTTYSYAAFAHTTVPNYATAAVGRGPCKSLDLARRDLGSCLARRERPAPPVAEQPGARERHTVKPLAAGIG